MTRFDHEATEAARLITSFCHRMSDSYVRMVLEQAELALISRHQPENISARMVLEQLRSFSIGTALQVLRQVRQQLLPPVATGNITVRAIREASIAGGAA